MVEKSCEHIRTFAIMLIAITVNNQNIYLGEFKVFLSKQEVQIGVLDQNGSGVRQSSDILT